MKPTNSPGGLLFVVSGPSGVGKGTVCTALLDKHPEIGLSVSATSRKPRPGEQDGVHYYFKTPEQFDDMIANNQLLEHVQYGDNKYGTPRAEVLERLERGENVVLEIEMRGGLSVKESYPDAVTVFVVPPSRDELERRLTGRGTETEQEVAKRLAIAEGEFSYMDKYDYILVNDTVDNAVARLESIIEAEASRREHILDYIKKEIGLL